METLQRERNPYQKRLADVNVRWDDLVTVFDRLMQESTQTQARQHVSIKGPKQTHKVYPHPKPKPVVLEQTSPQEEEELGPPPPYHGLVKYKQAIAAAQEKAGAQTAVVKPKRPAHPISSSLMDFVEENEEEDETGRSFYSDPIGVPVEPTPPARKVKQRRKKDDRYMILPDLVISGQDRRRILERIREIMIGHPTRGGRFRLNHDVVVTNEPLHVHRLFVNVANKTAPKCVICMNEQGEPRRMLAGEHRMKFKIINKDRPDVTGLSEEMMRRKMIERCEVHIYCWKCAAVFLSTVRTGHEAVCIGKLFALRGGCRKMKEFTLPPAPEEGEVVGHEEEDEQDEDAD